MRAEIVRLAATLAALLEKTIGGRVDLAAASIDLDELAKAVSASCGQVLDDSRLKALWIAAFRIVQADQQSGLGWVDLLPLLHRAASPLRVVLDAPDLDLDL